MSSVDIEELVASLSDTEVRATLVKVLKHLDKLTATQNALLQRVMEQQVQVQRQLRAAIPEAHLPVKGVPPPVGKTAQVLRAMGQNLPTRVWTAQELHEALTRYAWTTGSEADYASLLSTLSRMVKAGSINRVERGLYSIAPAEDVYANLAALTGQQK